MSQPHVCPCGMPHDGDAPMKDKVNTCGGHPHTPKSLAEMRLINRYLTLLWKEGRTAARKKCTTPDMPTIVKSAIAYHDPQKGAPAEKFTSPRQSQGSFPSFSGDRLKDLLAAYTRATKTTHAIASLQEKYPQVIGLGSLVGNFSDLLREMAPLFECNPRPFVEALVCDDYRIFSAVHHYVAEMKAHNLVLLTIQMLAKLQGRCEGDSRLDLVLCNAGSALAHLAEFFEFWCQKDFIE